MSEWGMMNERTWIPKEGDHVMLLHPPARSGVQADYQPAVIVDLTTSPTTVRSVLPRGEGLGYSHFKWPWHLMRPLDDNASQMSLLSANLLEVGDRVILDTAYTTPSLMDVPGTVTKVMRTNSERPYASVQWDNRKSERVYYQMALKKIDRQDQLFSKTASRAVVDIKNEPFGWMNSRSQVPMGPYEMLGLHPTIYNAYALGLPVGCVIYQVIDDPVFLQAIPDYDGDTNSPVIWVEWVWVDPTYRDTDLFQQLVAPVLQTRKETGYPVKAMFQNARLGEVVNRWLERHSAVEYGTPKFEVGQRIYLNPSYPMPEKLRDQPGTVRSVSSALGQDRRPTYSYLITWDKADLYDNNIPYHEFMLLPADQQLALGHAFQLAWVSDQSSPYYGQTVRVLRPAHDRKTSPPPLRVVVLDRNGNPTDEMPILPASVLTSVDDQMPMQLARTAAGKRIDPSPELHSIAQDYMNQAGLPYNQPEGYALVDPNRAAQIAQAYQEMPHAPDDPAVAQSYQAMKDETLAQYNHLVNNGYQFEFEPEGGGYASPWDAVHDVRNNKHLYVYPTSEGFGSQETNEHPLLEQVPGLQWNGSPVTYNDVFRGVHDTFGHAKAGVGFRHHGEDNAWREHSAMYSDAALPAMTSETRGQNSWVNFGPYGEQNQQAGQGETIYAPQKAGLLPDWAHEDYGAHTAKTASMERYAWWLPNKTAADIRELGLQAMDKLFGTPTANPNGTGYVTVGARPDLQKGADAYDALKHVLPDPGYDDEYRHYRDATQTAAWLYANYPDKDEITADQEEELGQQGYSKEETDSILEMAQKAAPYIIDAEQWNTIYGLCMSMINHYPGAYKLLPWFIKQLKISLKEWPATHSRASRPDDFYHTVDIVGQAGELLNEMRAQNRNPGFDINQLSYRELADWFQKYKEENAPVEPWESRQVEYTLSNGWTIERVETQNDLNREGDLMGHCVGGYCNMVNSGRSIIFSLRDPKGGSHATLEYRPKYDQVNEDGSPYQNQIWNPQGAQTMGYEVQQIQGKSNQAPVEEYRALIKEFNDHLRSQGYSVTWAEGAWRHNRPTPYDANRTWKLRQENTYHITDLAKLLKFQQDFDLHSEPWFLEPIPDDPSEDEYGITDPASNVGDTSPGGSHYVTRNWLNWAEVDGTTASLLEGIYSGTVPLDAQSEYGRALFNAYKVMCDQGHGLGAAGKEPRSWLLQTINTWIESMDQQTNTSWVGGDNHAQALQRVKNFAEWFRNMGTGDARGFTFGMPGWQQSMEPWHAQPEEEEPWPGAHGGQDFQIGMPAPGWQTIGNFVVNPVNYQYVPLTDGELRGWNDLEDDQRAWWKRKARSINNRASGLNAHGTVAARELYAIWTRFDGKCAYDQAHPADSFDHVIPLTAGGANTIDNLLPVARDCNAGMNDWDQKLRGPVVRGIPDAWREHPAEAKVAADPYTSDFREGDLVVVRNHASGRPELGRITKVFRLEGFDDPAYRVEFKDGGYGSYLEDTMRKYIVHDRGRGDLRLDQTLMPLDFYSKTAMPMDKPFLESLQFKIRPNNPSRVMPGSEGGHSCSARTQQGEMVGLLVTGSDGRILSIETFPDFQRKGVATALVQHMRDEGYPVYHDWDHQTDEGKQWAEAIHPDEREAISKIAMPLFNNTWYHVTSSMYLPKIAEQGLLPRSYSGTQGNWPGHNVAQNAVYLWPNISQAFTYQDMLTGQSEWSRGHLPGKPVILRITNIDTSKLGPDHESFERWLTDQIDEYDRNEWRNPLFEEALKESPTLQTWMAPQPSDVQDWQAYQHDRYAEALKILQELTQVTRYQIMAALEEENEPVMYYDSVSPHNIEIATLLTAEEVMEKFDAEWHSSHPDYNPDDDEQEAEYWQELDKYFVAVNSAQIPAGDWLSLDQIAEMAENSYEDYTDELAPHFQYSPVNNWSVAGEASA